MKGYYLTCICTGWVGIDMGIGCAPVTVTIEPCGGPAVPGGTCMGCPVGTINVGVRFIGGPTGVTPCAGTETIFGSTTVGVGAATCAIN